jgi:hypothetical protein
MKLERDASVSFPSGLLVLTGASHTGKSSVARALLDLVPPPAAYVEVDRVIQGTLVRPPGDPWREIPLAYELLFPQVEILLRRRWLVVFESTFTFVPGRGEPELHLDQLESFLDMAERLAVRSQVVQLLPDRETVSRRAAETGRLDTNVVSTTLDLHEAADLPASTLKISPGTSSPEELAGRILGRLRPN